jgi:DNA (cytosine-5)-methyltransferase 1
MAKIDYPAHLEVMWQKAIAPREPNAPKVISTFAGGGGSLTGYMMAGFDDLLAVEWDDNAVETLRLNWPDLDIYHGDIAKLSVEEVLRRTGLQPGELDILDGSPPCQGFSTAGKRILDDPRNQLFREYVRLLRGLRPKVFIMENVSGMVKGKMKLVFVEILKELKASGYKVSARLLNAMYFHVPQSRERMIFIGVRDDLGIEPSHPKAESKPIAVRAATENLLQNDTERDYLLLQGEKQKAYIDWENMGEGGNGRFGDHYRIDRNKPARSLLKSAANVGARSTMHWSEKRRMTTPEYKRCASFPDNYIFTDWKNGVFRIGNSVPPLFMEAIARHVRREILDKVETAVPHPTEATA